MKNKVTFNIFQVILIPFLFVFSLWIVYWIELRFGFNFNAHGLKPRTFSGLQGVLFSPFIHSSVEHLYNNSLPLFILLAALFYFYPSVKYKVLWWGLLGAGILTWIMGRDSYHIGASGVVYMLTSFLFFKGIWSKNYRLIALSLIVVFLYGSMVWGIFPQQERISWEGHLGGLLIGIVLAFLFKVPSSSEKKYYWEKENFQEEDDPFLQQFDEHGNFITASQLEADDASNSSVDCTEDVQFQYKLSKNKKE
ncbi:rhomboid family intramembrane serine protease [Psychroflexus planctonicus]|uniref:rhomboid family intramembrane serine protease n=1 Tax=Psychroflexus planctonicus TaxID=1526575 RepID=UPI00166D0C55|nr:rhomboid family intramembrane serine protease [Psychroflexus planctonicus]